MDKDHTARVSLRRKEFDLAYRVEEFHLKKRERWAGGRSCSSVSECRKVCGGRGVSSEQTRITA